MEYKICTHVLSDSNIWIYNTYNFRRSTLYEDSPFGDHYTENGSLQSDTELNHQYPNRQKLSKIPRPFDKPTRYRIILYCTTLKIIVYYYVL
jgi:hypothetical protein